MSWNFYEAIINDYEGFLENLVLVHCFKVNNFPNSQVFIHFVKHDWTTFTSRVIPNDHLCFIYIIKMKCMMIVSNVFVNFEFQYCVPNEFWILEYLILCPNESVLPPLIISICISNYEFLSDYELLPPILIWLWGVAADSYLTMSCCRRFLSHYELLPPILISLWVVDADSYLIMSCCRRFLSHYELLPPIFTLYKGFRRTLVH